MPALSDFHALFDDNLDCAGDLLLSSLGQTLQCSRAEDVPRFFAALENARAGGRWIALAAHYELGYALEPHLNHLLTDGTTLARAWIFRDAQRLASLDTQARLDAEVAGFDEHQALAGVAGLKRHIEERAYIGCIDRIRDWIAAGDCYQVNFTFALTGQLYGAPLALYRRLRAAQPVRHGAFIRHPDGVILSRSPELFVARRGARLTCRPMKGTAPRDSDPTDLAASEKNRAENIMIVDLIRNDLGRLTPPGGVRVERLCEIEDYPSVWQMTSTVQAEPVEASFIDVMRALFPCGSITGAPKIRAMEIIHALEADARGLYCGALGWLAPDGDFCFSVPIRTLDATAEGAVHLGLGSGIVADSEARAEFSEAVLKGRFLTDLRPNFGLIETLRCEPGTERAYPLLERHLRRLKDSAAHFGIPCDSDTLVERLKNFAAPLRSPHRVRVELKPDGTFDITGSPLDDTPPAAPHTVSVSHHRVRSDDHLLQHKTTARALYDAEVRGAIAAGHFDTLFFNEKGELAEGGRTSVFLDMGDGILRTPGLECGVLDGVYRRKLLDEGRAIEARLTRADLEAATEIYLANAVRGLIAARLSGSDQCAQAERPH